MAKAINLEGQRFGRLVAIEPIPRPGSRRRWRCKCDCGNETLTPTQNLLSGKAKSCGCMKIEKATKHGDSRTRIYRIWNGMKNRCNNENEIGYENYGGRGITVCEEWNNSFEEFRDWSFENGYKEGLTIDRIDVNGNYEPSNCRWVTMAEQNRNKRDNVYLTYNEETKILGDWARLFGIKNNTLSRRIKDGWTVEQALTIPASKQNRVLVPLDTKPKV